MISFFTNHPYWRNTLLFLIVVLTAFAMRTHNYNREAEAVAKVIQDTPAVQQNFWEKFLPVPQPNFMPYSIECAMMFGYVQKIAAGQRIPASDPDLHGLEDIAPYRQMIMGLEWFIGWGYRLKSLLFPDSEPSAGSRIYQDNIYLAQWAAVQLRFWISLSSGFIFLLLLTLKCRPSLSFFGGFLHAVAIAAIARSTGQDMIRGNFALPLITAFLLLLYSSYSRPAIWKSLLLGGVAFLAFSTWDLCLGFFSMLVLYEILRYLFSGRVSRKRRNAWIIVAVAVVLSSLLIPFNQTYQTIMSPLVIVLLPLLMTLFFMRWQSLWKRCLWILLLGGTLWLFWNYAVKTPHYVSHYSHFRELTAAKLKFNNVKPAKPEKLSYDARIMWTPAMHSADWQILQSLFPSIGVLTGSRFIFRCLNNLLLYAPFGLSLFYILLLAAPFTLSSAGTLKRNLPFWLFPVSFTVVFTIGFIYIVRYHEFLILFLALSLPLMLEVWLRTWKQKQGSCPVRWKRIGLKMLQTGLIGIGILLLAEETVISLIGRRNYSREVRMGETAALIAWFREAGIPGKCVLTDFSLGPMLKCYAGQAIALQPQFGLERIRRPVQQYSELLYHGREAQLIEFCRKLRVDYIVYNHGYVGPMGIYSDRYIANARKIRGNSPVNLMRYRPDLLLSLCRVEPPETYRKINGVYRVFRVIYQEDRIKAVRLCFEAEDFLMAGKRKLARERIRQAMNCDPTSQMVRRTYYRIFGNLPKIALSHVPDRS